MRLLLAAALILCLPVAAQAQSSPDELVEIRDGELPQLRSDRAYLLFRIPRYRGASALEPLFMRVPTVDEIARFQQARAAAFAEALPGLTEDYEREFERRERRRQRGRDSDEPPPAQPTLENFAFVWSEVANLQAVDFSDTFARTEAENTYLVEAPPGEYILYGMSPSMGLPRMEVCFCLGTVGFSARAGHITDLGYVIGDYARERSVVPELAAESGYGPSSDVGDWVLTTGTVRPAREDSSMPAQLSGVSVTAGEYHAVGRYFTPNTNGINRLVPVPGILAYDRGQVIDVRSGALVPDNL